MKRLACALAHSVPMASCRLGAGTAVVVSGLRTRPALNDTIDIILGFDTDKERYKVELPSAEKILLKPANVAQSATPKPQPVNQVADAVSDLQLASKPCVKVSETARLMRAAGNTGRLPVTVCSR
eukprot:4467584-Prymnesium_polylepis.1